uniref:ATP synthase complex subunit 8 n=1 Tax=Paracladura trichoptera TaxID=1111055 RepID=G8J8J5_9DIPT|nr:ATP synthase F0 subunit 8 [Paracladura trichoptera]AET13113.1 ATP synthase F0 subunit 8 [Paracladura trichoptera]
MPQMSPLKWLTLFMMFSFILLLFNIMNYFIYHNPYINNLNLKKNIFNTTMPWKW